MIQFLIDECLSLRLVDTAENFGYLAHHVTRRGWSGKSDNFLLNRLLEENLTLVTNNWRDFEPMLENQELHPGALVIPGAGIAEQIALFQLGLEAMSHGGLKSDMTNKVIVVNGPDEVRIFDLPS